MRDLYFSYPAFYTSDGTTISVEIPDLDIAFTLPESARAALADTAWERAAHCVQRMLFSGQTPPESRTLEDVPVGAHEARDAFLIELQGK